MLSAVVLTKNEEANIKRCLKSVDCCDEIIVIDDNSEDNTVKIAKEMGATVYQRALNSDFAAQRNFGLEKAKGDWILFIDADEEVTLELKREIIKMTSPLTLDPFPLVAFSIKRRDFFWGKEMKYGETQKIRNNGLIRLVKKDSGQWTGKVHEEFIIQSATRRTEFKIRKFKNYLNHYPHPTVKDFLQEINFYSTLRAKELKAQGKKTYVFEIILFPLGKFMLNYFLKLGFLDGPSGFAYAFFMSFHSFLVRTKSYQYWNLDL